MNYVLVMMNESCEQGNLYPYCEDCVFEFLKFSVIFVCKLGFVVCKRSISVRHIPSCYLRV